MEPITAAGDEPVGPPAAALARSRLLEAGRANPGTVREHLSEAAVSAFDWFSAIYVAPYVAAMVVCVLLQSLCGTGDKD